MLKIVRSASADCVVFTLSGRIEAEHAAELQATFAAEVLPIILDLEEVKLVDRDIVACLARWEAEGVTLRNCPGYIREWIDRGRSCR